ncbi:MAG: hypothetical protein GKS06_10250 [Acidobacteria bacterium]|nr:hypothetical protein [Acidobacteriota bacterium]
MLGLQSFTVVLALWASVGVFILTLLLFAVIVGIRLSQSRQRRRSEELTRRWRSLLSRAVVEEPTASIKVSRRDAPEIMSMWGYYHEFLRGDCKANLNRLAHLAGLDLHAKRGLRSDSIRHRLLSIHVLGNLRDRETRGLLRPISRTSNPYLSLAAAHALMRISPRESINDLIPMIARRPDWPPAKVMAILQEAGPEVVGPALAEAAIRADVAYQPLLLVFLGTADEPSALRAIKEVLIATDDQQVIITGLYQLARMAHPDGLRIVRIYLEHPNWLIQLHAVQGIGRMGNEADVEDLTRMLRHRKYWIRLRAAEALAKLPTMDTQRLAALRDVQTDRYARDILHEVLGAEVAA